MRISSKIKYAVRAMIDMINQKDASLLQIKDIAKRQKLSVSYLENIFSVLSAKGLLKSEKGKGGGFSLAKNPDEIKLLDIVDALEGRPKISKCLSSDYNCSMKDTCPTKSIWKKLNSKIEKEMASVKLSDITDIDIKARKEE